MVVPCATGINLHRFTAAKEWWSTRIGFLIYDMANHELLLMLLEKYGAPPPLFVSAVERMHHDLVVVLKIEKESLLPICWCTIRRQNGPGPVSLLNVCICRNSWDWMEKCGHWVYSQYDPSLEWIWPMEKGNYMGISTKGLPVAVTRRCWNPPMPLCQWWSLHIHVMDRSNKGAWTNLQAPLGLDSKFISDEKDHHSQIWNVSSSLSAFLICTSLHFYRTALNLAPPPFRMNMTTLSLTLMIGMMNKRQEQDEIKKELYTMNSTKCNRSTWIMALSLFVATLST